jgi:hypothetical protein
MTEAEFITYFIYNGWLNIYDAMEFYAGKKSFKEICEIAKRAYDSNHPNRL